MVSAAKLFRSGQSLRLKNFFIRTLLTVEKGAMYAFPKVELPAKFIAEAESKGAVPDAYYCSQLLEATGICVVPGSGFRQKVLQKTQ